MNDDKLREIRDRIAGVSHPDGVRLPPTPEETMWLIAELEKTDEATEKLRKEIIRQVRNVRHYSAGRLVCIKDVERIIREVQA